ncbi:DUF262 domain-containing protein [Clostridium botulinum]|uniref:DUF262 domain-containing protein n=1 Tax=Clostridium botulinum TaxID=1491 RepID=UPI0013F06BF9|nr:DUF262 domain-containing protein [Clostridium botulinum]MBY6935599.1 DUF262 domain-containing protein [Clostridium botulinum]NFL84298.1 DUF262 domain-containing protein [Clostridium botulinum]NFN12910.1 DUF262 domain-containing protein [Clostridium botulinum]NFO38032.1 DUF262 domain-containing protein [Clostridium botulinum]NFO44848.1 DUF262 domain-containing protein [Clostridium botulinum]
MEAREEAFYFMQAGMSVEIPFFQRGYVWNEDNWEELIDNLLDDKQSHFLGSIILKQQYVPSGQTPRCSVIDGQQRLTTLSILLRACYDSLPLLIYSDDVQASTKELLNQILFFKKNRLSDKKEIKIKHSMIDTLDYRRVVNGEMKDKIDSIILQSETKNKEKCSSNILQCYKYFVKFLRQNQNDCEKLWQSLTNESAKILVKIDLKEDENEQAIFDTVNSAGVRLTCFDTIKNALFQRANENAKSDLEKIDVINLYKNCWEVIFSDSQDKLEFWNSERKFGRMVRNNQEVLLHCIALIKGFYDPEVNKISDLSQVYKKYINDFNNNKLFTFINEIVEYAETYRNNFIIFDKSTYFKYSDDVKRLFHILNVCEVSTLHPYILKLFKNYQIKDENEYTKEFLYKIKEIEKYVIRHSVCQVSTKNFNKDCALLVSGKTSIAKLTMDKSLEISNSSVTKHLKEISNNKLATLILFWIELKRRYEDSKFDMKELKYTYSLEHIMPQKWEEYWNTDRLPVTEVITNIEIKDKDIARNVRSLAIYEIGNMTLLNSKLNTSLRNYEFTRKINGEGRKKGIKDYASLDVALEIIRITDNNKPWNESIISKRTESLTKEFVAIW